MSVQVPLFEKGDKKASKVAAKVEEIVGEGFDVRKFVENFEVLAEASGTVPKLRQLIRTLAVSGRLTKQRSGEDARELLTALKTANAGTVRKKLPGDDEEIDAPAQLPGNWCWARFLDVASIDSNLVDPAKFLDAPHVAPDNIEKGTGRLIEYRTVREDGVTSNKHRFFPRQIVYSKIRPNLSKVVVVDFEGVCSADMYPITSRIDRAYLHQFMLSQVFLDQVVKEDNRLAMPKVNQEQLGSTLVAVPPLAEQKRIVAKVDQLMALCDELEAKQTKKRETGARLTKSALDALTSAEGPDDFDAAWKRVVENFDVLIDRAEKVGELRLTIMDVASHGRLVRQHENDPPATVAIATKRREIERCVGTVEVPDDRGALPPGWTWELLGNLGADAENPIQTGPFGAQLHRSDFVSEGVPVIAVGNLTGTGFTTDGLYFVTRTKAESLSRYDIHAGDLLFARSGATTGKVCVAPHFVKDWRMTGHILRVRLDPHLILPELVVYWLWGSAVVRSQIMGNIRGGTRPGYNTSLLKSIVVPVPPLAEQGRILAKIAHLMEVCDQLEERLRSVEDRASKLVEAVVRELVA